MQVESYHECPVPLAPSYYYGAQHFNRYEREEYHITAFGTTSEGAKVE